MTVTVIPAPLSVALREETAAAHETAEQSDFMARLLAGEQDSAAVSALTSQLWFVYTALEAATDAVAASGIGGAIHDARLVRRPALDADLRTLLGDGWRDQIRPLGATADYVARLEELASPEQAHRVVAHHYVRYMGDIAGGQVIAQRLKNLYGIPAEALNFYDFEALGKIPPYRADYRSRLDALELTDTQREETLAEAKDAFAFNTAMFADLAAHLA